MCLRGQNWQGLLIGRLRQFFDFQPGATTDRVFDHNEGVVGQAQHAGDVFYRHLERFGADHHRALAQLFEADAVMQTARGTAASIAYAGDQKIDILSRRLQSLIRRGGRRIRF